jgi:HEAT repeat protein
MSADQESSIATLAERLTDAELTVRVHAGLLLGARGVEARPALATLLALGRSEEVQDRRQAGMTLGLLAGQLVEAVPPLLNALHDEDEAVRRLATEALDEIAPARGGLQAA